MNYNTEADFQWFIAHQDELMKKFNGKTLAIRDGVVLGAYASAAEAVARTRRPLREYMIQLCIPGDEAHTVQVYTPVVMV